MSDTVPTPTVRDQLVKNAQSLPSLIAAAQTADPALAEALTPKALAASKSPWGTLIVGAVAWASAHYGFGWDDTTCTLVSGVGVLIGSYAMRAITMSPIGGFFHAKPATPPTV